MKSTFIITVTHKAPLDVERTADDLESRISNHGLLPAGCKELTLNPLRANMGSKPCEPYEHEGPANHYIGFWQDQRPIAINDRQTFVDQRADLRWLLKRLRHLALTRMKTYPYDLARLYGGAR